jgi:putative membrane protein
MSFTIAISKDRVPFKKNSWLFAFIAVFVFVWSNSLIGTTDTANWLLENTLTFIFVTFLIITFKKHQFSDLQLFTYLHLFMSACIRI